MLEEVFYVFTQQHYQVYVCNSAVKAQIPVYRSRDTTKNRIVKLRIGLLWRSLNVPNLPR